MSFTINLIIYAVGLCCLLIWLVIFAASGKYTQMFLSLEEKEYPFRELYGTGYWVLERLHYSYKTKGDRKLRQSLEILYDAKYTEFYLRVTHAQQISLAMLVFLLAFPMYALSGEPVILLIFVGFAGLAYYYFGTVAFEKLKKRSELLIHDFSEAVSQLALLTNAGMILREAWEQVANNGSSVLYEEMRHTMDDMNNGISEIEAIRLFGARCMLGEIKKFSATIIQGLTKGNRELVIMLQEQSSEVWSAKKQSVRRQGEKAGSKLLIPICIMFIGVLIMIIVPIFTNLGV